MRYSLVHGNTESASGTNSSTVIKWIRLNRTRYLLPCFIRIYPVLISLQQTYKRLLRMASRRSKLINFDGLGCVVMLSMDHVTVVRAHDRLFSDRFRFGVYPALLSGSTSMSHQICIYFFLLRLRMKTVFHAPGSDQLRLPWLKFRPPFAFEPGTHWYVYVLWQAHWFVCTSAVRCRRVAHEWNFYFTYCSAGLHDWGEHDLLTLSFIKTSSYRRHW